MVFLELYFGYFDHKPAGTPLPIMHVQKEYFKPVWPSLQKQKEDAPARETPSFFRSRRKARTLTFRKLETLARLFPAVFLSLDRPRIAREKTGFAKLLLVSLVEKVETARDTQPNGSRLPRPPAAVNTCEDVERGHLA
jgi:hypothetical protein